MPSDEQISRFISGLLRHFPDQYDIEIDQNGWCGLNEIAEVIDDRYNGVSQQRLIEIIEGDENDRYELSNGELRAKYGHSIEIDIGEETNDEIPSILYHGTNPDNIDSIQSKGILPMDRQKVHLSENREKARDVGKRHSGKPVILEINASLMQKEGWDLNKRGKYTYTVEKVEPKYIIN